MGNAKIIPLSKNKVNAAEIKRKKTQQMQLLKQKKKKKEKIEEAAALELLMYQF